MVDFLVRPLDWQHPIHEGAHHVSPQPSSRLCRGHSRDGDRRSHRRLGVRFHYVARQAGTVRSGNEARSGEQVRSKQIRSGRRVGSGDQICGTPVRGV